MIRLAVIDKLVKNSGNCIHKIESEGLFHTVTTSEFNKNTIEGRNPTDNLVIVLNVKLSSEEGQVLLSQIESQQAKVCLYLSLTDEDTDEKSKYNGLLANADWILLDNGSKNTLVDEIDKVFNKGKRINPKIASRIIKFISNPEFKTWNLSEMLTTREAEILHLTAEGYTNKQIAEKLTISALTVKNHAKHIFKKIGASNRSEAVKMYLSITKDTSKNTEE